MTRKPEQRLLIAWYLIGTPIFALLDFALDLSWRVAGLESPELRLAYYAALIVLGVAMRGRPWLARLAALAESSLAIAITLIGAWTDVLGMTTTFTGEAIAAFDWLVNLLLCGGVGIYAFNRSVADLRE
ncbi:MAG: hypothetical protein AAGE01_03780 [Pseudomonadota bacterium]